MIVVGVLLGVAVAFGLFFGLMWSLTPIMDEYLQTHKEIINLYDFYESHEYSNQFEVYFIGSSIIGDAIYTPDINDLLVKKGYDISTYNLFVSGDIPLYRSLQIQNIIKSRPSLVIYGITYKSVTCESWSDERTVLVHDKLNVSQDSYYLYNSKELEDIFIQCMDPIYRKKFLKSTLLNTSNFPNPKPENYAGDPYGVELRQARSDLKNLETIISQANDPTDVWHPVVTNESTRYKQALIYNVRTLQSAGIPVILINMPLHPLTSEKITDESRQNFYDLLNETGAKWCDMERGYGDEYFFDSHHMTFYGATQFAPRMADLIIQEVESGAVHYA